MSDLARLGDHVGIITGNPFKSSGYTDEPGGIRLLRGDNIGQGKIRWDGVKRWPAEDVASYARYRLRPGDVIIAMDRPWIDAGLKYAELRDDDVPSLLVQRVACLRAMPTLDQRYLGYLIGSPQFTSHVLGIQTGTAVPHISSRQIQEFEFPLLEMPSQKAIGKVLGALDDKITVNGKVASTALGLALAKYAEMRTAGLLPRSLPMADSAHWSSGGTPKTSEESYWGGDIPWISALSLKSPWVDDSDRKVTALGAANGTRLVPKDTIIFVVRGSSLDTDFRIGLTQREVAFGQDCKALRAIDGIDPAVLFVAIKAQTSEILKLVDHTGHGAGRLATDLLSKVSLSLPDAEYGKAAAILRPLVKMGAARQAESRMLAELRDTLLPRLMSGEIRVREAEKVVEEVVLWAGYPKPLGNMRRWRSWARLAGVRSMVPLSGRGPGSGSRGMS